MIVLVCSSLHAFVEQIRDAFLPRQQTPCLFSLQWLKDTVLFLLWFFFWQNLNCCIAPCKSDPFEQHASEIRQWLPWLPTSGLPFGQANEWKYLKLYSPKISLEELTFLSKSRAWFLITGVEETNWIKLRFGRPCTYVYLLYCSRPWSSSTSALLNDQLIRGGRLRVSYVHDSTIVYFWATKKMNILYLEKIRLDKFTFKKF